MSLLKRLRNLWYWSECAPYEGKLTQDFVNEFVENAVGIPPRPAQIIHMKKPIDNFPKE